jgi:hypothetical protein
LSLGPSAIGAPFALPFHPQDIDDQMSYEWKWHRVHQVNGRQYWSA